MGGRRGAGRRARRQVGPGTAAIFNFYAEYIMRNAGLEETQAGIKIAGRNTNNLRSADDTTLMLGRQILSHLGSPDLHFTDKKTETRVNCLLRVTQLQMRKPGL